MPIEPMHNLGVILRVSRFHQNMDVVGHQTQSIELELIFFFGLCDRIQKDFATGWPVEVKATIIATDGDMVGRVWGQASLCVGPDNHGPPSNGRQRHDCYRSIMHNNAQ